MSDAWRLYASAPEEGALVCPAGDLSDGRARCVTVVSPKGEFPLLVLRRGDAVLAYVNACPHQYLPLDCRSPNVTSADGARLLCSAHGAMFDAATGACLSGATDGLDPVPVAVDAAGDVRIG